MPGSKGSSAPLPGQKGFPLLVPQTSSLPVPKEWLCPLPMWREGLGEGSYETCTRRNAETLFDVILPRSGAAMLM